MEIFKIYNQIQPLARLEFCVNPVQPSRSSSFAEALQASLEQVDRLQLEADARINGLATGKQSDFQQTMIAVEKANVSFELLMQIRGKVISAYEKIMYMQV
jgi:flagellar hook-basal body complex protein FliE